MEIDCHAGGSPSAETPYQSETSTPTVRGGGGELPLVHTTQTQAEPTAAVARATHVDVPSPSPPVTHVAPPVTAARAIVVEPPVKRTASGKKIDTALHCTVSLIC